jgi:mannosyltransferase OCH1-like enzyme
LTRALFGFDSRLLSHLTGPYIIQWAYNAINPKLGAAKADVWRYAVMWCYGGFYMDYDSDFSVLLDDAILPTDTLLVAQVCTYTDSSTQQQPTL